MAEFDDDYEGDLQPLRDELAALRQALGDSYKSIVGELDGNDLFGGAGPSAAAEAEDDAHSDQPPDSPHRRKKPEPLEIRIGAVKAALKANQNLQTRLQRLLTSIDRAEDQLLNIKDRVTETERKLQSAAAAPRAVTTRPQQEQYSGVSWYWTLPGTNPPPPYPGSSDIKAIANAVPLVLPKRSWTDEEGKALAEGVLQVVQESRLNEILSDLELTANGAGVSLEQFESRQAPIKELKEDSPEVAAAAARFSEADWETVAHRSTGSTRSGLDCKLQWLNVVKPGLLHTRFTPEEDAELLQLVEQHGPHAWFQIAAQFRGGGVRSAVACLGRYQQLQHNSRSTAGEFTQEDMERLKTIVKRVGVAWKRVAEEFGGPWNEEQLMHQWRRYAQRREGGGAGGALGGGGGGVVQPRKGKWTAEEDNLLRAAVALKGKKWSLVAALVPGRTDVQCRERYVNCLDPSIKTTPFTVDEDEILSQAVAENMNAAGKVKWVAVAAKLPGRTDKNCLKRWNALKSAESKAAAKARQRAESAGPDGGATSEVQRGRDLAAAAVVTEDEAQAGPSREPIPMQEESGELLSTGKKTKKGGERPRKSSVSETMTPVGRREGEVIEGGGQGAALEEDAAAAAETEGLHEQEAPATTTRGRSVKKPTRYT